jgi:hypothetical protein
VWGPLPSIQIACLCLCGEMMMMIAPEAGCVGSCVEQTPVKVCPESNVLMSEG